MVYTSTYLKIIDNSGARYAQCIKVLGRGPQKKAQVGDKMIVTVKVINPKKFIKKGQIFTALLVRDNRNLRRRDGTQFRFDRPAAILMKKNLPYARRILGPVSRELRRKGYLKVISLASVAL